MALTTLSSKLEPSLDLMTQVALQPDFPADDWELMQSKLLQDLEAQKKDPNSINSRAWSKLLYGEQYLGHHPTSDGYTDMTTEDMKSWYDAYFDPSRRSFPLAAIPRSPKFSRSSKPNGSWETDAQAIPQSFFQRRTTYPNNRVERFTSSIVLERPISHRAGTFVGNRLDSDYAAFLANHVIGGQFSARINFNLRKTKDGLRCLLDHLQPSTRSLSVRTSVVTPHIPKMRSLKLSEKSTGPLVNSHHPGRVEPIDRRQVGRVHCL